MQDYIHKVPIILHGKLQRECHETKVLPPESHDHLLNFFPAIHCYSLLFRCIPLPRSYIETSTQKYHSPLSCNQTVQHYKCSQLTIPFIHSSSNFSELPNFCFQQSLLVSFPSGPTFSISFPTALVFRILVKEYEWLKQPLFSSRQEPGSLSVVVFFF